MQPHYLKSKKLGSVVKSTNKWSNNILGYDSTLGQALPELGIKSIRILSTHKLSSNPKHY